MTACEQCWDDAGGDPDRYRELVDSRKDNPCSPEDQAGGYATNCTYCERRTVHQYAGVCMNPLCPSNTTEHEWTVLR